MTLPMKPDKLILQLLIHAKAFQDHAIGHANSQTPMDKMIAIHNLDNSIEYILKIIVKHLDIEVQINKNLDTAELASLAGEINKFLKSTYSTELPYLADIKLIRQVRNLVQHAMVDPGADLPKYITISERFFEKVLNKIFGLTLNEIKLSSIIENESLKDLLKQAESYIENNKFIEGIVACRDLFENFVYYSQINSYSKSRFDLIPIMIETKSEFNSIYYYLKNYQFESELAKFGIESRLIKRFNDYLSYIPSEYSIESNGYTILQREWEQSDAIFCYNFVADLIYKWESSLLKPIYETKVTDLYENLFYLDGLEINGKNQLIYLIGEYFIQYCVIDNQDNIKKIRERIKEKYTYEMTSIRYENGVETFKNSKNILIRFIDIRLITNNPPRWELIIEHKDELK